MTNEALFRALAGVEPELIEESDSFAVRRRTIPKLALIAAIAAALSGTVLAAGMIRNYLTALEQRLSNQPGIVEDFRGTVTAAGGWLSVELTADVNPDHPDWIEQSYLPMYFVEHWAGEPVYLPQSQQTAEWKEKRPNIDVTWKGPAGEYAVYRQEIIPLRDDSGVWPYDEIPIGYNETVESGTRSFGAYPVFWVEVPPSCLETEGGTLSHPGYRRYFWSDGDYVFSLELSYDAPEDLVEQALDTMTAVENPDQYREVLPAETEPLPTQPEMPGNQNAILPVWVPTELPEGWNLALGRVLSSGYAQFEWRCQPEGSSLWSVLTLEQGAPGDFQRMILEHETTTQKTEKLELSVSGITVVVYSRESVFQAYWTDGEADYELSHRGMNGLSLERFLEILQSIAPAEDLSGLLTQ